MKRLLGIALLLVAGALTSAAAELNVFAAASLSDVLTKLAPLFETSTGHHVQFNFGASGTLARQVKEGAPADVFFSADVPRVDELAQAGLLLGAPRTLIGNQLVIVTADEGGPALASAAELGGPSVRRIAIGDPATVPAGTYAKAFLQRAQLWPAVAPKLVPVDNVRAVLAAVAAGNADAGFVYATDARISKRVKVALTIPPAAAPKILYPIAVVRGTGQADAARAFIDFLASPEAQKVFAEFGFIAPK